MGFASLCPLEFFLGDYYCCAWNVRTACTVVLRYSPSLQALAPTYQLLLFLWAVCSPLFFFFFLLSLVAGVSGFSLIMCYVRTCDQKPLLKYENINNTGIYVRVYILYAPNDSHVLCLARIMPGCYARQDTFKSTYLWCAATGIHKSVTRSSCRHKSTNHSTNRSSNQSVEQPFSH